MLVSNRSRNWRWNTMRPRTGHALGSLSSGFKAQREYMYVQKNKNSNTLLCSAMNMNTHNTQSHKIQIQQKYNFTYSTFEDTKNLLYF